MSHARYSPSGASGWLACPGWQGNSESSAYSAEGTLAHDLAQRELTGADISHLIDQVVEVDGHHVRVTEDMIVHVRQYTSYVRSLVEVLPGAQLLVEQKLPLEHLTGEADAHGTADAVVLAANEIIVVDLKFGRGVPVDARDNPQLRMYAAAAMREYDLLGDFQQVRTVIHQPRLSSVSEDVVEAKDLEQFVARVRTAVTFNESNPDHRNPGDKQCRWCARAGDCAALREQALADFEAVEPQSADAEQIAYALGQADLIESWLKAVRARAEQILLAGDPLPGFKLVAGKRGPRKWSDAAEVEDYLKKSVRLTNDEMYEKSLISPTTAEKLVKAGTLGERQWARLQELITQSEGSPSVAPESDKRPAIAVTSAAASDFDDVTA